MLSLTFVFKMDYNLIWEKRGREIMRKLKRIIIMICTTFFVVLLSQVGTHAAGNDFLTYSGTQSGIDMGFDTMNEARNNCYTYELPNSSGVIASNATITKAYDFHIYKIHINDTGYYSFYTTSKEGLTSIMTTERNLCVERWFTNTLTMQYSYSVSSYSKNETLIYGQEYIDGIWS